MTRIICLANSWKHGDRCIAGINPDTGTWIRPVSDLEDGRIPETLRLVDGDEPKLLDILDIPLADTPPRSLGFARENRAILPGSWQRVGQAKPADLFAHPWHRFPILHNRNRRVTMYHLCSLPLQERCTLQLVYAAELVIEQVRKGRGRKWQGIIITATGQQLPSLTITDPLLVERLDRGHRPAAPCLVTLSLGMPFCPSEEKDEEAWCWKLIAGVLELSDADVILAEMQRVEWSLDDGRVCLQRIFGKRSRKQLTPFEITQFLDYLKSLPSPEISRSA